MKFSWVGGLFSSRDFSRNFRALALTSFLLFPFFVLIFFLPSQFHGHLESVFLSEFFQSFIFSSHQAIGSALLAVFFGLVGAVGMAALKETSIKYLEWILLFPNIVPVLFIIITFMNITSWMGGIPFGYWGIVGVHLWLNVGLVSVALNKIIRERLGPLSTIAWVDGVKPWTFIWRVLLPSVKNDLIHSFIFVFSMSFSSFAVPLVLGGGKGVTLEVLIFEKIRLGGHWLEALLISFLQVAILFLFVLILKRDEALSIAESADTRWFGKPWGLVFPILPSVMILLGSFFGFKLGLTQFLQLASMDGILSEALIGSLVVAIGCGLGIVFCFLFYARLWPVPWFEKFLLGFLAPSSVITGFALLIFMESQNQSFMFAKVIFGLTLMNFPIVYKLFGASALEGLRVQLRMAKTLGASQSLIMSQIIFPQVIVRFCWIGGLAGFWSLGEFGFLGILIGEDLTLSLLMKSFLSAYRLELATFMIWPVLSIGIGVFIFFGCFGKILNWLNLLSRKFY